MEENKMAEIKKVHTTKAPEAIGPYSQATILNGVVYTSGQIAINPATGNVESDTIEGQTEQIFKNLSAVLEEAGTSLDNTVKTVCFLADVERDFGAFNKVYEKFIKNKPARSCVGVKALPKNVLAEVEVIAAIY